MNQRTPEKVVPFAPSPFAPATKEGRQEGDPIDRSGHAVIALLQEAVEVAKTNCERAMDIAHKLSLQLRNAEERIAQLEGEVRHYQDRSVRAEKWMHRIHTEIEDRFFKDHPATNGSGNGAARR